MDNLGPCCACRQESADVRNLLCLHKLAPVPGTGWGNVLLGWPSNGAVAIVCDQCLESNAPLVDAISGYPAELGRIAYELLEGEFGNDAPDEYRMTDPGDDSDLRYSIPPDEDDDDHVPIVLFQIDEFDNVTGATEISDDQAGQLLGTPGLTSLSWEQTKKLYGVKMDIEACACVHTDARECYRRRYGIGGVVAIECEENDECECGCHNLPLPSEGHFDLKT